MKTATLLPVKGHHKGRGRGLSRLSPMWVAMQVQALELRKSGLTYIEIGKQIGRSQGVVVQLIRRALLDTIQEPADQVRALELHRLDALWKRVQPKIKEGDLKAVEVALKIMQRRAALLGLDAPVTLQGPDGAPLHFVVALPPQAASVEAWQAEAGKVLDVVPEQSALGMEVCNEHA